MFISHNVKIVISDVTPPVQTEVPAGLVKEGRFIAIDAGGDVWIYKRLPSRDGGYFRQHLSAPVFLGELKTDDPSVQLPRLYEIVRTPAQTVRPVFREGKWCVYAQSHPVELRPVEGGNTP